MFTSIEWIYDPSDKRDEHHEIIIRRMPQMDGSTKYSVRQCGACMDADGNWEIEPRPSSRTDKWLSRFRFASWEQAADAIVHHCRNPLGRFAPGKVTEFADCEE